MAKISWKIVKQTAMKWHINDLQKKGWICDDIKQNQWGIIKRADFHNEAGDRLYLEPKLKEKFTTKGNRWE